MGNKYPIYIISKGRYEKTYTADLFYNANIKYYIAVEPQEYEKYVKKLGSENVLKLPFSNLGVGSYPARNFCWEHSIKAGYKKHWLFDDNIRQFYKWENSKRKIINNRIIDALIYLENYSDNYNINITGFEEYNFSVKIPKRPFKKNCHVYSAMLIQNNIPFRWRLKYNEDVDLCLQVLKNNGTTASCVYYLADKISTSEKMKGGNQDELYKGNDPKKKLLKVETLKRLHPNEVKIVKRFNRIHHLIDWKKFNTKGYE